MFSFKERVTIINYLSSVPDIDDNDGDEEHEEQVGHVYKAPQAPRYHILKHMFFSFYPYLNSIVLVINGLSSHDNCISGHLNANLKRRVSHDQKRFFFDEKGCG